MADLKCQTTIYITPPKIVDPVRSYFPGGVIPLDPATEPDNPLAALKFAAGPSCNGTSLGDGLDICWADHEGVFLNPPYGKGMKHWCAKIHEETVLGASILALLPCGARFGTRYWQDHIFNSGLDVTLFVRGRVQFLRPDGSGTQGQNPYDSQLLGFNVDVDRFVSCFKHLGKIVKMEVA
jgi:site-specific DNA-methyltransferase (adenine-specific)